MPVGLVVKNGSNARSRTSRLMPAPVVGHRQQDVLARGKSVLAVGRDIGFVEIGVRRLDGQAAAIGHRVAGVDGEVEDRVFELIGIDRDLPQAACEHGLDGDGLADRPAQQFRHALHQPVDVDRLDLLRMLAGEREQALHQRGGALGGLARRIEQALDARIVVADAARGHVDVAEDDGEHVVEVVRDAARQPADRLHLLRLTQRLLGRFAAADLLLQTFACGEARSGRG